MEVIGKNKNGVFHSENKYKLCEIDFLNNTCILNASYFISQVFKLKDERVLYTDDKRNFAINNAESDISTKFVLKFKWKIVQFSIENSKWIHDVSFWHNKNHFCLKSFMDTIRNVCSNLVNHILLIDLFTDITDNTRHSRCYRLVYESCDRCLPHSSTTMLQFKLREALILRNKLNLR